MTMKLASSTFEHNAEIPVPCTCDGQDISPQLEWSELPAGTQSLALIVDDPDAPDPAAPRMTWVHWVLYNIPPAATGLEQATGRDALPAGTGEGINDWGQTGYRGPCPPVGRHRYFFKLYALDTLMPDLGKPKKPDLLRVMEGHILEQAELIGTYQRTA
jgi:Raf kinase inhibitor-like YbhB/YbcL family protein